MKPYQFNFTPAAADTDGYAAALTGVGPFTITATSGDGLSHLTSLTSTANLSTITITITGTTADGNAQTDTVTGPNNNTATGTRYFATVTSIAASATLGANTMDAGWAVGAVTPVYVLDWREIDFQVALGIVITGTVSVTVQHCMQNLFEVAFNDRTWFNHVSMTALTASADGNYAMPVTGTRVLVNSVTPTATVKQLVVQASH